jgi:hypothetical protein
MRASRSRGSAPRFGRPSAEAGPSPASDSSFYRVTFPAVIASFTGAASSPLRSSFWPGRVGSFWERVLIPSGPPFYVASNLDTWTGCQVDRPAGVRTPRALSNGVRIRTMHPPWCFSESAPPRQNWPLPKPQIQRPQPLSVCRTKDCIFFHDQDDQFFRDFGRRSTTRLKHEDLGGALLNLLSASLHLAP